MQPARAHFDKAVSFVRANPKRALIPAALVTLIVLVTAIRLTRPSIPTEGTLEAEALPILKQGGEFTVNRQEMPAEWSGKAHLFGQTHRPGEWVELALMHQKKGNYRITAYLTYAPDYATVRFSVNGKEAAIIHDLFKPIVEPSGPVDLGVYPLTDFVNRFRIQIVGKNRRSLGYYFGIDAIHLDRVD